ncbi:MAG: 1-(5-phosphoribosyl)-5-((5-phosphoribosylamino)methylideneamino)imidazole-4-carboxamide isomerase, partial [Acidobacteria bacterium]|nr:1-(5-phosphoribosyl)-5-((5-phosphoribosylamino)methylideneamino)imidazole-4-carboxamide isomerase [Acidobacteriota bacterium]
MNDSLRLWPAIDVRGGRIVRLLHGSADAETRYDGAPADAA